MNDRLYGFYDSELEALRGLGGQFARRIQRSPGGCGCRRTRSTIRTSRG